MDRRANLRPLLDTTAGAPDAFGLTADTAAWYITDASNIGPAGWDAALSVEGFAAVRNVLSTLDPGAGPHWQIRDLFHAVPVAVIEARVRVGARPLRGQESVTT